MYRLRDDIAEPLSREALRQLREAPRDGAAADQNDQLDQPHMQSNEYRRLRYLLGRYCKGEVDGLSVLISGQRGAGKTTLAKLAIQHAIWEADGLVPLPVYLHGPTVIDPAARPPATPPDGENGDAAKAGPTACTPGSRSIAAIFAMSPLTRGESPPPNASDSSPAEQRETGAAESSDSETDSETKKTQDQANVKNGAFRLILGELYRCLSRAIYDAWLNAIDESPDARRRRPELLELRAHLDLTVDRAPDYETLRTIWERAGFLYSGVAYYLTPARLRQGKEERSRVFPVPAIAGDERDQGLREIIALSACADTYNVILGKPTERRRRAQSVAREREYNLRLSRPAAAGEPNGGEEKPKASVEKLAPPALGTLAGAAAVFASPEKFAVGLVVGGLVWLASALTLTYGVRRELKKKVDRELDLDIDWSPERIERDLPLLLKRVKDSGFAPIFIVDELDKVAAAAEKLEQFLHLAKHIVTDYAAFMFLTDRTYYEHLLGAETPPSSIGRDEPVPPADARPGQEPITTLAVMEQEPPQGRRLTKQREGRADSTTSTFFTHRIFVSYSPDDYREYLFKSMRREGNQQFERQLGLLAWGTILVYRSQMVPFNFNRRLTALLNERGAFTDENQDPRVPLSKPGYRQELTMQLAAELVMRRQDVRDRMEEVPIYQQYTYDTLYYLNFLHLRGRTDTGPDGGSRPFEPTVATLRKYLEFRAQDRAATEREPAAGADGRQILLTDEIVDFLFIRVLDQYIELLLEPRRIRQGTNEFAESLRPATGAGEFKPHQDPELWTRLADAIVLRPLVTRHVNGARI
jgi:hypothetical protein